MYSSLGVLRDIHQNHLTELLTLLAMDLPEDGTDATQVSHNKERLLRQVLGDVPLTCGYELVGFVTYECQHVANVTFSISLYCF